MTQNRSRHASSAFAENHRESTSKRGFSPTLRLKALAAALGLGVLFWATVIYFLTR